MIKLFKNIANVDIAIHFYKKLMYCTIFAAFSFAIAITVLYFRSVAQNKDTIYMLTADGQAILAKQNSLAANRPIEAQAHAKMFILLFFDIDQFTKEERIKASYDLGTSCIYNLHQKLANDKWFTQMEQYNVMQKVIFKTVSCTTATTPYIVNIKFDIIVSSEASDTQVYNVDFTLTLGEGNQRSIQNPHALMINDITINDWSLQ